MASSIQLLRSTIAQERPLPGNLLEGQPAVNLNAAEPGLFFKAADGSLVKFGPAAITSDGSPPNSSPRGSSGNTVGELWLDKSTDPAVLKVYDGTDWIDAGSGGGLVNGSDIIPGSITGDKLANGAVTSTNIENGSITGDKLANGTVTSTNIENGTIVDADIASNAAISSSKLNFLQSGSNSVPRSVESRLQDIVNVKDFGAVGNGVFDDGLAIQRAVDSAYNKTLYIPAGTYLIRNRNISISNPIKIVGEGHNTVLRGVVVNNFQIFTVSSSNVKLESLAIDSRNEDLISFPNVTILINNALSPIVNFTMCDVLITGINSIRSDGSGSNHGVLVGNRTSTKGMRFDRCIFDHLYIPFFTTNLYGFDGARGEDCVWSNCSFTNNSFSSTFNTDFDTSGVDYAWENVRLIGCIFKGEIGDPTFNTRCTVIGGDGVRGLTISNCQFIDLIRPDDFVVHVENYCDNFVCVGNTFRNVAGAISYYSGSSRATIANNVIASSNQRSNSDDPSSFPSDPPYFGSAGIYLTYDATGSPSEVVVTGNVVEGFRVGINLAAAKTNILVSNNIFNLCTYGFRANGETEAFVFKDNRVSRSKFFGFLDAADSATLGNNVMDRCPNFITGLGSARNTLVQGLKIINTVSITASTPTKFPLIPMPIFGIGTYSGRADNASGTANESSFYCNYRIDSSGSLSTAEADTISAGSLSCPVSFLTEDSGNLSQSFLSTTSTTLNYEVEFSGNLVFS